MSVAAVGALLTMSASWGSYVLNQRAEHRLLDLQTRQAGAIISASVLSITDPLNTGLEAAVASDGNAKPFEQFMASVTGPAGLFVSSSLLQSTASPAQIVATVGTSPWLDFSSATAKSLLVRAAHSSNFVVISLRRGTGERIGYAVSSPTDPRFLIYAERAIPTDRQVPIETNSAFSDLDYATYLGSTTAPNLATTDVSEARLPLTGYVAHVIVPFGNSQIILAAKARGQLGGSLGADLPWILLPVGLLLTVGAVLLINQVLRRQQRAEQHAETIAALYGELDGLYGQQRSIAEELQRALLPSSHPNIPGLAVASRYVAGVDGAHVGGDWYSVIELPDDQFGFVVGDVSGRGISAATVMAWIRYTIRAYLLEGHAPADVLAMCSQQIDVGRDGHFATALVGVGNCATGEVELANAGHLNPLLITDREARLCPTRVGVPLGIGPALYESTTVSVPIGGVLLGYTDGLIERRDENLDAGLQRLAAAAAAAPRTTLDNTLTELVAELLATGGEDDVAIIAIQRLSPHQAEPSPSATSPDSQLA